MKMWLCCAFVCSLVACQSSEEKWRSYHESAETYLSNGQHVEAILQYRNALKAKPKATESLRGLATAYRRTGEWIEALSVLDDLAVYAPEDRLLVERARYALAGEKAGLARRHIYDQRVTRSDDLEALVVAAWLARNEARRESAHQELFAGLKEGRTEALGVTGLPLALEARLALSTLDESLGRLDAARRQLADLPAHPLVLLRNGELSAASSEWDRARSEFDTAREAARAQESVKEVEHQLFLSGQWRVAEVWRLSGSAFAPYLTAEIAYRDGHPETAATLLKPLLDHESVGDAARILCARALRELERFDQAAEVLLPVDGGDESKMLLGLVLTDAGKPKEALPAFQALAKANPTKPDYAYYEGRAQSALGDPEAAREAYERALLAPGGHTNAFHALVELDLLAEQSGAAKARIERALSASPQDGALLELLGVVEESSGEASAAEQAYRSAIRAEQDSASARRRLGQLLMKRGEYEEARSHIDRSLVLEPDNLGTMMMAGMLAERLREVRAAMRYYRDLLDRYPTFYPAANNLAYLYAEEGTELSAALRLAQGAHRAKPDHGGFLDTLGWVHFQRGDYQAAARTLEQAAKKTPNRAMIWVHLGLAEEKRGEREAAVRAFETASGLAAKGQAAAAAAAGLNRLGVVKSR